MSAELIPLLCYLHTRKGAVTGKPMCIEVAQSARCNPYSKDFQLER